MLTPVGWRDDHPGFGIPDLTFKQLPIGPQTIEQLVSEQESRVAILITEEADRFDQLVDRIRIGLQARGGETL